MCTTCAYIHDFKEIHALPQAEKLFIIGQIFPHFWSELLPYPWCHFIIFIKKILTCLSLIIYIISYIYYIFISI